MPYYVPPLPCALDPAGVKKGDKDPGSLRSLGPKEPLCSLSPSWSSLRNLGPQARFCPGTGAFRSLVLLGVCHGRASWDVPNTPSLGTNAALGATKETYMHFLTTHAV